MNLGRPLMKGIPWILLLKLPETPKVSGPLISAYVELGSNYYTLLLWYLVPFATLPCINFDIAFKSDPYARCGDLSTYLFVSGTNKQGLLTYVGKTHWIIFMETAVNRTHNNLPSLSSTKNTRCYLIA